MKSSILLVYLTVGIFAANCQEPNSKRMNAKNENFAVQLTDEEWRQRLTPEEYYVLRKKGTERPFTGRFYKHFEPGGVYVCKGCGNELFASESKFDSHCGWPSYDRTISEHSLIEKPDYSFGMVRTEILCAKCGGHIGHVFNDGPTETGLRYCVNSVAIDFKKVEK